MNPAPTRTAMSIGEVLVALRPDFPDVSISKIRFLESEGLVEPQRSPSGYRKFSSDDVERLRYVLSAQRDHYLPLRVIREQLDALDRGLEPPAVPAARPGGAHGSGVQATPPDAAGPTPGPDVPGPDVAGPDVAGPDVPGLPAPGLDVPGPEAFAARDPSELRLSRRELLQAAGIDGDLLDSLETYGLLTARGGGSYDGEALLVAKTAAQMSGYGIEPRHLRAFRAAADREVGLIEQVVTPLLRQRSPEGRARAEEVTADLAALGVRLHATLVKAALRR